MNTTSTPSVDAQRIADFVLFTQRSCILNLSTELNRGNVSYPQFFLMTYLAGEESLTMSDIAKKMSHSTAAATGLVDRLEKMGYLVRSHAEEDRRKVRVKITNKGLSFVQKMRGEIASQLSGLMEEMDTKTQEGFAAVDDFTAARQ